MLSIYCLGIRDFYQQSLDFRSMPDCRLVGKFCEGGWPKIFSVAGCSLWFLWVAFSRFLIFLTWVKWPHFMGLSMRNWLLPFEVDRWGRRIALRNAGSDGLVSLMTKWSLLCWGHESRKSWTEHLPVEKILCGVRAIFLPCWFWSSIREWKILNANQQNWRMESCSFFLYIIPSYPIWP